MSQSPPPQPLPPPPPPHPPKTIIILGSGIIGLTTAITLASHIKKSHESIGSQQRVAPPRVQIWSKEHSPNITSDRAGAIWEPFLALSPIVDSLAHQTWHHFQREVELYNRGAENAAVSAAGIQLLNGYMYNQVEKPHWVRDEQKWERMDESTWRSRSFLIDMSKYMPELDRRARELGVQIRTVTDLHHHSDIQRRVAEYERESASKVPFIINATGLGAMELFGDEEMAPVLGYTLLMKTHTGQELMNKHFYIRDEEGDGMMYVLPRTDGIVVCGGTAYFNKWDANESEEEAETILKRIETFAPQLRIREVAKIHKHSIGLRPYRKSGIRIETDTQTIPNLPVIHCYGMGGSGVTLCWGAANLVCQLAEVQLANQEEMTERGDFRQEKATRENSRKKQHFVKSKL